MDAILPCHRGLLSDESRDAEALIVLFQVVVPAARANPLLPPPPLPVAVPAADRAAAVADGRVFAINNRGLINAVDAGTGQPLWEAEGETGNSNAMTVVGDALVATVKGGWGGYDQRTGKRRWGGCVGLADGRPRCRARTITSGGDQASSGGGASMPSSRSTGSPASRAGGDARASGDSAMDHAGAAIRMRG